MTPEMLRRKGTGGRRPAKDGLRGSPWEQRTPSPPRQPWRRPLCGGKGQAWGDPQARQTQAHPPPGKAVSPACIRSPRMSSARLCSALRGRRGEEEENAQMHISSQQAEKEKSQPSEYLGVSLPRLGCAWVPIHFQHTEAPHRQPMSYVFTPFSMSTIPLYRWRN